MISTKTKEFYFCLHDNLRLGSDGKVYEKGKGTLHDTLQRNSNVSILVQSCT